MSATIREALRKVADARAEAFAASEALKMKRAVFAEENAALLTHETTLKATVATLEGEAKALVLQHYKTTKDKAPVPGCEVKLFRVIVYDDEAALAWARRAGLALVPEALDRGAFEKIAKATPLPFVEYDDEPRATIAAKLNPALLVDAPVTVPADDEDPFA